MSDGEVIDAPQADAGPSVEDRARAQGWRPKEEFKGPAERWRPADAFLKAAEDFMPVAIERNRKLEADMTAARGEIGSLKGELGEVKQVLTEFRDFASKGEQRAYERARKEILAERDVAVAHADTAAFKDADSRLAELDKSAPPVVTKPAPAVVTQPVTPKVAPEIERWIEANPWFNSDPVLHQTAKALDARLQNSHPDIDLPARLAMVKTEIQKRFPENFENPNREAATSVSTPSGAPGRKTNKHSYENLPPEAKKACDKFVKTIPGFKAEDYVRDYAWES